MFICIPIVFGLGTRINPIRDGTLYACPRCHNNAVVEAKSRKWFELFWIPLIPFKAKHIYLCSICQWNGLVQEGSAIQEPPRQHAYVPNSKK